MGRSRRARGHETSPTSATTRPRKAARPGRSTRATWLPTRPAAPSGPTCSPRTETSTEDGRPRDAATAPLEREIASRPGTFFFCCLLYADDSDLPAAIDLGVLRPDGLHTERFRNRFDL